MLADYVNIAADGPYLVSEMEVGKNMMPVHPLIDVLLIRLLIVML